MGLNSKCITRVVVDGHEDLELAELQSVMHQIQIALSHIPSAQRTYIGNALLNLAVCRMLRDTNPARTATVLARLVDSVLERSAPPPPEAAIDLTAIHS